MIQALRSSRQASATEKSMSDKKIDEIMKQVMSHAQEWMEEVNLGLVIFYLKFVAKCVYFYFLLIFDLFNKIERSSE